MKFTVDEFNERFPTDRACLVEIMNLRYGGTEFKCPKCKKRSKFFKLTSRPVYSCMLCRHQISPLAGTIFHKSSTSLRTWFFAIYLMAQTKAGISAKQLERMTGVTYKTAWRMFKRISQLKNRRGLSSVVTSPALSQPSGRQVGHVGLVRPGKSDPEM